MKTTFFISMEKSNMVILVNYIGKMLVNYIGKILVNYIGGIIRNKENMVILVVNISP